MNEQMSIQDVVAESGLCENYVRKAIRAGKLVRTLGTVSEGSRIPKNYIERKDFEAWRASITAGGRKREDGRNKFVMYMSPDEEVKVRELLAGMECESLIARANQKSADDEVTEAE